MRTTAPELTRHESQALLAYRLTQITPPQPPNRSPGVRPLAVLIGGTPGTGKSTIQWLLQSSLGQETVAVYDYDDDAAAHPRYEAIMRAYGLRGQEAVVQSLPPNLFHDCLAHLRLSDPPYDLIASAPLEGEDVTRRWVDRFRPADYRVVLVYAVTNEANSALGRANRYQLGRDDTGIGRWVLDSALGSRADNAIPDIALAIEAASYVDDLYIVDRDGYVLYENHRGEDGLMAPPFLARDKALAEHLRPATPAEHDWFVVTASPLLKRGNELAGPVADLVRWAWDRHEQRPVPRLSGPEPSPELRLDQRLINLQRIAGAGLAPPSSLILPSGGPDSPRGTSGRSVADQSRDR